MIGILIVLLVITGSVIGLSIYTSIRNPDIYNNKTFRGFFKGAVTAFVLIVLTLIVYYSFADAGGHKKFIITVPANNAWTDTGIDVKKGDTLLITASGIVNVGDGKASPDGGGGFDGKAKTGYPMPSEPANCLIGRIGSGNPFKVGSYYKEEYKEGGDSGRLLLGINDDTAFVYGKGHTDNRGKWKVRIERTR